MSGSIYLGAAYFDGDPGGLLPAYQRMLERFGLEALDVHLCITSDAGLTVFDACPTKARSTRSSPGARRSWARSPRPGCPHRASAGSATSRSRTSGRRSARERRTRAA